MYSQNNLLRLSYNGKATRVYLIYLWNVSSFHHKALTCVPLGDLTMKTGARTELALGRGTWTAGRWTTTNLTRASSRPAVWCVSSSTQWTRPGLQEEVSMVILIHWPLNGSSVINANLWMVSVGDRSNM